MIRKTCFYNACIWAPFTALLLAISLVIPPAEGAESLTRIAVLPFEIHTLKAMDHLAKGLQAMMTERLAREGFDVMDPAAINKSELSKTPLSDVDLVRKVGRDNNIDWLIGGSLTQIGEKMSVDLTAVPTSGERRSFSIFAVGNRVDQLVQVIEQLAGTAKNRIKGVAQIDSLSITGNKRIETDAILAVIESQKGMIFDPEALNKDLRSIYEMGFFEDVQIEVEDGPGGKIVTFKVSEKPSIGKITFEGNKKIDKEDLEKVVGIRKYVILNRTAIKDSMERLRDHYHQEGYHNVEVRERIEELPNNEVALTYHITEGDKVFIREIRFIGNVSFDDDDLKDVMKTSEKGFFSFFSKSGNLDRKKLESDISKINSFYHNNGYIKAQVGEPDISYQKDEGLIITITINEGPQYTLRKVSLKGDLIKETDELYKALKITQEKVYNGEVVRSDALKLSEIYANEGYAYADIARQIEEDDKEHTVDITYRILKGEKVKFERIEITGNDKTRDKVIRRELQVVEGGYFSAQKLQRSAQNLHRLGFFEEVQVDTKPGSTDEDMMLDINVQERPTGMLSLGVGYSSVEKAMGIFQVSENNLFGRGQSLSARVSVSTLSTRYIVSFIEPWLFGKPLSAGIDIYDWEYEYNEYTKDSTGGNLRFGFPLGLDFTRGSVIYTYDDAEIWDISETAAQAIKDMEGRNVTSSMTFGVSRDSRDRRFNATRGSVNVLSVEYAGGFLGGDNYFTKYKARSALFFPFFWDTAFSVQGRWGFVEQRSGGQLPVYEKFRLGGMNTVRGFEYESISPLDPDTGDRIGGEKMMAYNLEFRFPFVKEQGVMGVLFFDAGNVFTKDEDYTFSGIRMGAGAGIRWYSPAGPLRLEWAKNLDPKPDEPSSVWEFTIGTPF